MVEKHHRIAPELLWEVQDVLNLPYSASSFDVVLDKGMADALMCGDAVGPELVSKMMNSLFDILPADGIMCVVSFGEPATRTRVLTGARGWLITSHPIKVGFDS